GVSGQHATVTGRHRRTEGSLPAHRLRPRASGAEATSLRGRPRPHRAFRQVDRKAEGRSLIEAAWLLRPGQTLPTTGALNPSRDQLWPRILSDKCLDSLML